MQSQIRAPSCKCSIPTAANSTVLGSVTTQEKQRNREAEKQRSREAEKQRSREAEKQRSRSREAEEQRSRDSRRCKKKKEEEGT